MKQKTGTTTMREDAKPEIIAMLEAARDMHEARAKKPEGMLFAEHFIVTVNDVYTVGGDWDPERNARVLVIRPLGEPESQYTQEGAEYVAGVAREAIKNTAGGPVNIKVVRWYVFHAEKAAELQGLIDQLRA